MLILIILCAGNLISRPAHAELGASNFPGSRLGLLQTLYSGEKGKSLSEAGVGYGIEMEKSTDGNGLYSFYLKVRGSYSSGTQTFLDGTASPTSKFTFYQGAGELGVYLFPVRRDKSGLNVYIGGGGTAGYNYISVDKGTALTTIPHTGQSIGTGYSATLGGEFLFRGNTKVWSASAQLTYHHETSKLLNQNEFDLSGIILNFGIGF